jgi:hypothetical protein
MEWIEGTTNGYWDAEMDDDSNYAVSIYDGDEGWCAAYNPPGKVGGYLSNNFRIECGYGAAWAMGLKSNCRFATKEEAQAICERHHNLLILQ